MPTGAKRGNLAVLNLHVKLADLCHTQISEGLACSFDCISGSILPGIRATAYQLDNFVYAVSHFFLPSCVLKTQHSCGFRTGSGRVRLAGRCHLDILILYGKVQKLKN